MHVFTYMLLGALIYGLLEALIIIIVVRYYPEKIGQIQRAADAIFRLFAHPKAAFYSRDPNAVYGVNEEGLDEADDHVMNEFSEEEEEEPNEPNVPQQG